MILKGINIPTILIVSTEIDQRGSLKKEAKSFTRAVTFQAKCVCKVRDTGPPISAAYLHSLRRMLPLRAFGFTGSLAELAIR